VQATAARCRTALSFIEYYGVGANSHRERNHFLLTGIEMSERRIDRRRNAHL
jgi:hypothetical protein